MFTLRELLFIEYLVKVSLYDTSFNGSDYSKLQKEVLNKINKFINEINF